MIETVRSGLAERGLERSGRFIISANLVDNMRVHLLFNRLCRDPERILDGEWRAGAMRNDADAVDAEKRAAAVLLVVCFSLDGIERIPSEKSANFPHPGAH